MDKNRFSENLTAQRNQRELTQKQVAEALGISDKTYSKWETGETEPGVELICRLGAFYGISPAAFFEEAPETGSLIRRSLQTLTPVQAMLRAREQMDEIYDGLCDNVIWHHAHWDEHTAALLLEPLPVPPAAEKQWAAFFGHGADDEAFYLRCSRKDADLRLLLMPCESGFSWMTEEAAELNGLFRALSHTELLRLLIRNPPDYWYTPEYLSGETGVPKADVREAVQLLCDLKLMGCWRVQTADGEREIYQRYDTRILRAIYTLAHLLNERGREAAI